MRQLLAYVNSPSLHQTLMSAEKILRSVALMLYATTSLGLSAVNVKMGISSAVMGRPALVSGSCVLPSTYTELSPCSWDVQLQKYTVMMHSKLLRISVSMLLHIQM